MLSEKDRDDFRRLRRKRGLLQRDVAELLGVHRAVISNAENGRTLFERTRVGDAMLRLLEQWRREEREQTQQAVVREGGLLRDFVCPYCKQYVPGPSGAKHCVECGADFAPRECRHCHAAVVDAEAVFCVKCGKKLD